MHQPPRKSRHGHINPGEEASTGGLDPFDSRVQKRWSGPPMQRDRSTFWGRGDSVSAALNSPEDMRTLLAKHSRSNFLFSSLDDAAIEKLSKKFERRDYEPGEAIVEQGTAADTNKIDSDPHTHYYILADGECQVVKDGKPVAGEYGIIEKGTSFGEVAVLFGTNRTATIMASKPSEVTGTVVVYRLRDTVFHEVVGDAAMEGLRTQIREIQKVVDIISGVDTKFGKGTVIRQYVPSGLWLCKQWSGTVLQYVWTDAIVMMVATAVFGIIVCVVASDMTPLNSEHEIMTQLEMIAGWWPILSGLATFVSTFFLSEAYNFWRKFYWTTRAIQGRINDISLFLASNASRNENDGSFTEGAEEALDDIGRIFRLLNRFYWCDIVKRYRCLLTPEGISYLRSKKLLTQNEFTSLIEVGQNGFSAYIACLTWLTSRISLALKRGDIDADQATMITVYGELKKMRGLMADVDDMYDGRMPLAYIHFVHLLVLHLLLVSPLALFPLYWFWSVPAVGILTLFYKGIFKLSLMFLDPVDNDEQHQIAREETVAYDIGVLIRESEAHSVRWKGCAAAFPEYSPVNTVLPAVPMTIPE